MNQLFQPFDYSRVVASGAPNALQSMQMLMQMKDQQRRNYLEDARRSVMGGLNIAGRRGETPTPAAIQTTANRMWGIDPDTAARLQTWASTAKKDEIEGVRDRNRRAAGLLAYVQNSPRDQRQAAYAMVRQRAIEEMGFDPSEIPEQYDPNFVGMQIAESRDLESILERDEGRAKPEFIRSMEAFGIDPTSEQGFELGLQYLKDKAGGGADDELRRTLQTLQVEALDRQAREAESDSQRKDIAAKQSVFNTIETLDRLVELNDFLSQQPLARTGIGFDRLRTAAAGPVTAFASILGIEDKGRAAQIAASLQEFDQLSTKEALEDLFSGQMAVGTVTNQRLSAALRTKPGVNLLPEVNNRVFAAMYKAALDSAEQLGVGIDRDHYLEVVKRLRGKDDTGAIETDNEGAPNASGNVIRFEDLPDG